MQCDGTAWHGISGRAITCHFMPNCSLKHCGIIRTSAIICIREYLNPAAASLEVRVLARFPSVVVNPFTTDTDVDFEDFK